MWKGGEQDTKNREKESGSEGERGGENGRGRDAELGMDGIGIFPQKKP